VSPFSESARQIVHMSMGGFALLLRFLTPWQAAACAALALGLNALVLPRVAGARLFRPGEAGLARPGGIVFYPLSVLLLVLVFPSRLDIVAAAWGILAVGDGAATLVGRRFGGWRWPWNPDKTLAGSLALAIGGGISGVILLWWTRPAVAAPPPMAFVIVAPLLAAAVAALVETRPIRLDDNLSVPLSAAAVLWLATLVSGEGLAMAATVVAERLPAALVVNASVAWAGHRLGTVTWSGTIAGVAIGLAVWLGAGPAGWIVLFTGFLVAAGASRVGLRRKAVLGIAEARAGRRGAGNALANCLVGAVAAVVALVAVPDLARLAMVAALTAGASDTVASEIGKAWGRRTFLVTSLAPVPPGTSGAVSLEGTAAGVVAALLMALVASALGLIAWGAVWIVVVAATIGAFVESALGATLEGAGVVDNDALNFINTALAAAAAVAIARSLS